MIPKFPEFKILDIEDKEEIEIINKKFPTYSDYNFVSLYSWNTDENVEICTLNNNLVIKFNDYLTDDVFFSFLGTNKIRLTVVSLITYSKNLGNDPTLRLIPESVTKEGMHWQDLIIEEDRNNFDYILSVEELIKLPGERYRGKKNFLNRYNNSYAERTRVLNLELDKVIHQEEIIELFNYWERRKESHPNQLNKELKAIKRLFKVYNLLNLTTIGLYVDNKLIGFSINEILGNNYGMIHFQKADISFTGAYTYLKQQSAIAFQRKGCEYINYQQDMGIDNLRKAKLAYHPVSFLKKYTITIKEND
jgi:uncharacterized protein